MNRNGDHFGNFESWLFCAFFFLKRMVSPNGCFQPTFSSKIPCWWPGTDGETQEGCNGNFTPKNAKDDSLEQDFQFSTVRKKFVSKHQKRPWFGAMVNHDPKRGFGPFDFNLVSVDFQSHQGAIFPQLFPRKFSPCSCFLDAFFPHKKNPTVFGRFGWKGGTRWYLWDDWAVSSWPWWNCCFRDEQRYIYVIQSEIGITLSHGKDSHEPTSIKECHIYEYVYIGVWIERCSSVFQAQN